MSFEILQSIAMLAGILLPLLPLNRWNKQGARKSKLRFRKKRRFSDYAVDEYGNLVEAI